MSLCQFGLLFPIVCTVLAFSFSFLTYKHIIKFIMLCFILFHFLKYINSQTYQISWKQLFKPCFIKLQQLILIRNKFEIFQQLNAPFGKLFCFRKSNLLDTILRGTKVKVFQMPFARAKEKFIQMYGYSSYFKLRKTSL